MRQKRPCGGCKECCILYPVPDLHKLPNTPCPHLCEVGCALHDKPRPEMCTTFLCAWVCDPARFPEANRPDKCGMIFSRQMALGRGCQLYTVYMRSRYSAVNPLNATLLRRLKQGGHVIRLFWSGILNGGYTIHKSYVWDEARYPRLRVRQVEAQIAECQRENGGAEAVRASVELMRQVATKHHGGGPA